MSGHEAPQTATNADKGGPSGRRSDRGPGREYRRVQAGLSRRRSLAPGPVVIRLRPAAHRRQILRHEQQRWDSFGLRDVNAPLAQGLGVLMSLDENRLAPGARSLHVPCADSDIVSFVHEGSLQYGDAMGRSGVIEGGEFQRRDASALTRRREVNTSMTRWAHVFHIGLHPPRSGLESRIEQMRFSSAQRRGRLCVVASLDAREESLRLQQDARMHSAILHVGHHVVHEIAPGRCVWIHVVQGEVSVNGWVLRTGDGAALDDEHAVSLTAREHSEILLIDLVR